MIYFHIEDIIFNLGDQENLINWLNEVSKNEEKEIEELNYIFCSDEYLLNINQQYLSHDYYTDIITFPYQYTPIKSDIFISIDRVEENSSEHGSDFLEELYRVMVHGLLHMIGYDDHSKSEQLMMRQMENKYLLILPQKDQE